LLGIATVEFEMYGVPVAETEPLELEVCDPIAVESELIVPGPVFELNVAPELTGLEVFNPIAVELELVIVLNVLEDVPVELVMPMVEVLLQNNPVALGEPELLDAVSGVPFIVALVELPGQRAFNWTSSRLRRRRRVV
jgi:hypothetical protein